MDIHREAFKEEARELLEELEAALLELEKIPQDEDLIGRVFRAMHTIKGSGAMFGFDDVAAFTHHVETVFDAVRNGKISVTKPLIDITLTACDEIRKMIQASDTGSAFDQGVSQALTETFKTFLPSEEPPELKSGEIDKKVKASAPQAEPIEENKINITYRIRFKPESTIFNYGTNPILLINELRELGFCSVAANTEKIPLLTEMDPEACYSHWDIILTTTADINAVRDIFIFVEDYADLKIEVIDDEGTVDSAEDYKKIGEILIERGDLTSGDIKKALKSHKKIGELLIDAGLVDAGKIQTALLEQQHVREVRQKRQAVEAAATLRVPAERLDTLVNMVGELVTVQSRLNQLSSRFNDLELTQVAEEVERLTAELRDNTMGIRMLPIGTTFSKFQRLVRDLSAELGKEIVLKTDGAETELDKTVIEKLNDPLVHLIRNCIDHGIENPAIRKSAGKPAAGTVHLAAEHAGANVLLRITDDGAGLDKEAIRLKAVERGLIPSEAVLPEKDLFALILAPGFSTAKTVTSVSGRGVGMDVVKRGIEALQGSIEIESRKGEGTTITLKLPLTMAIIDGLLVRINEDYFVMPLSAIEECVELTRDDVSKAHGKHIASIRNEIVPYVRLREKFGFDGEVPAIEQIVTTRINGDRIGFVVDQVIGGHQTVIKSLGRLCRQVEDVSGATIMGDGRVALILDLPKLAGSAEREQKMNKVCEVC
ncbi:MAG: Chemotaxis protein CheA [Syntrophus sp. SKADARSKE-3]|nr:Chemotaxis protein CheA [Syntrophus sp. SKADARSKE-3]